MVFGRTQTVVGMNEWPADSIRGYKLPVGMNEWLMTTMSDEKHRERVTTYPADGIRGWGSTWGTRWNIQ